MDTIETTYPVLGMTCGHCAGAVTGELLLIENVSGASVDLEAGTATIVSDGPVDETAVREAVEEAGYALAHAGRLPLL